VLAATTIITLAADTPAITLNSLFVFSFPEHSYQLRDIQPPRGRGSFSIVYRGGQQKGIKGRLERDGTQITALIQVKEDPLL